MTNEVHQTMSSLQFAGYDSLKKKNRECCKTSPAESAIRYDTLWCVHVKTAERMTRGIAWLRHDTNMHESAPAETGSGHLRSTMSSFPDGNECMAQ